MGVRRVYIGPRIPPRAGGFSGGDLPAADPLTSFLYITPVEGSDHYEITTDETNDEILLPSRLPNDHHRISPLGTAGSAPLFLSSGRVEIG